MFKLDHLLLTEKDQQQTNTLVAGKGEISSGKRSKEGRSQDLSNNWEFANEDWKAYHRHTKNEQIVT